MEIVVDAGGESKTYEVAATRAGRRVETVTRRGQVEVSELTRGGTTVRTARFMASRVIALVEHPAARSSGRRLPGEPSARSAHEAAVLGGVGAVELGEVSVARDTLSP